MPSLTKKIAQQLMDRFKNEDPETIIKIIQEIRNNIKQERIDLCNISTS
jgi:biotin synthase-like enzyme